MYSTNNFAYPDFSAREEERGESLKGVKYSKTANTYSININVIEFKQIFRHPLKIIPKNPQKFITCGKNHLKKI